MKVHAAALLAMLTIGAPGAAQTARPMLDYSSAAAIRDGCVAWAAERKLAVAVAVFDERGTLMAFALMDGAASAVGDYAQWKGRSAATIHVSSAETAEWGRGPPVWRPGRAGCRCSRAKAPRSAVSACRVRRAQRTSLAARPGSPPPASATRRPAEQPQHRRAIAFADACGVGAAVELDQVRLPTARRPRLPSVRPRRARPRGAPDCRSRVPLTSTMPRSARCGLAAGP